MLLRFKMLVLVVVNAVYSEELIRHLCVTSVYMLYTCGFHRLPLQPTLSANGTQDKGTLAARYFLCASPFTSLAA